MANEEPLLLKYGGKLVEQLGAQMYPSATATVAELISNAWDADANNVWVEMPFDDWQNGEIVVVDDGVGMDRGSAQAAYLMVGRNRRQESGQRTVGQRLVHGRKGIGKLAAFGTANILEVRTLQSGQEEVAFRLDYNHIRDHDPDHAYEVEESTDTSPLVNPRTGKSLKSGTRIRLSGLQLKRRLNPASFRESMSRRFALAEDQMAVHINGEKLRRYQVDLQFRYPPDALPVGVSAEGDWAVESVSAGRGVRWWMGFTEKPIQDEAQQGVSVIVRGRLAQRPFTFDAGGGTTGQLGQEYLVGEIEADWIDDENADPATMDLIQSNRDQLRLEDPDFDAFVAWGQKRVRWALAERDRARRAATMDRVKKNTEIAELLAGKPRREQQALTRVADAVSKVPATSEREVVQVMEAVVGAREEATTRSLVHDLAISGGSTDELLRLLSELAELDGRRNLEFLDARLATLEQLTALQAEADTPILARELLLSAPGLLSAYWDLAEIIELSSGFEPATVFAVGGGDDSQAVIVIFEGEPTATELKIITASAREAAGQGVVVVVGATGTKAVGAVSWADLLAQSVADHEAWRDVVTGRLERIRAKSTT